MKLWTIILGALAVLLAVAVIIVNTQLSGTKTKLKDSEQQVASLQGQVSGIQGNVSSLNTKLADQEKASAKSLQDSVAAAAAREVALKKDVDSKQATIAAQAAELKTMKYPRHFSSLIELTNWLQKDDANTRYAGLGGPQLAFILQIRASRDGYLLPVRLPLAGSLEYITNMAVIGDVVYSIRGTDDFVERWGIVSPAPPSYPIIPDSGQ
jgi:uncharacterized protein YoxC